MTKISAIIIARNEKENISDCIKSLNFTDEIILIDNDSVDKTAEIASSLKAKVYKISGLDFSYLRNVGKEKAKGDWLLYIDADERVSKELTKEIAKIISGETNKMAFSLLRKNYFLGRLWPKTERMIRLIRKNSLLGWQGSLHETPIVTGEVGQLDSPLLHYTHRDFSSMVEKTNEWSNIEAQLRYKNNHPPVSWWRFIRVMFTSFIQSYVSDGGWRVGIVGLIESIYQSFSTFITYAKLWEMQNSHRY